MTENDDGGQGNTTLLATKLIHVGVAAQALLDAADRATAVEFAQGIAAARKEGRLARDPVHRVTKHLQQGIESAHFRLKMNMPRVGGFRSFNTARRSIQGFEAMLWIRKGFGFAGPWTVVEQNRMLGLCFGLSKINKG